MSDQIERDRRLYVEYFNSGLPQEDFAKQKGIDIQILRKIIYAN